MEKRKNPEKELNNKSGLFYSLGLLIAMMLCVSAFEYRVQEDVPKIPDLEAYQTEDILPPITEIKPPPPPPKPKIQTIVEVKNDEPEPVEAEPDFVPIDDIPIDIPEASGAPPVEDAAETFIIVEDMPEPQGGYEAFYKFVRKNLKYPAQARRMGIEGKVFVQFIVSESGELSDIKVIKGIGAGCDEEVQRIMEKAPKWSPGKQRGIPVKVRQVMPIAFLLGR